MTFFEQFKFQRLAFRLGGGFGVLLALMLLMLLTAGIQLWRIESNNADNVRHTERLILVQDWSALVQTNLERALTATRLDAASGDEAVRAQMGVVYNRLNQDMAATTNATANLQKKVLEVTDEPAIVSQISQINDARTRFVNLRAQIRDDIQMGEGGKRIEAELAPLAQSMLKSLDELVLSLKTRSTTATQNLADAVSYGRRLLIFICVVAIALGVAIAWWTTRAITRPMRDAVDIAENIAQGDLTSSFESTRQDEIGSMLRRLSLMQQKLRASFEDIAQSTSQIELASQEVAAGNADLSHRTEQTASNLQQTASAMAELTGAVSQSSESARMANEMSLSAANFANRGGAVVGKVVETMNEIHASSSKIASIIGVIDGIAFQTNILALNAAVEAARAGEQGRGFAVVASEVRNLAQRSAEAAREIKALIGTSVNKVEDGSRLVQEAGKTMDDIVSSVQRVTDMMSGISAVAMEQNQSIGNINASINQLDGMTQQNAALVEQSAASAESLREQAQRLSSIVANFRWR